MFRKELQKMLGDHPMTLREVARKTRVTMREIEEDLNHLARSLKNTSAYLDVTPAQCRRCQFLFGSERWHKPSKCPQCHGQWITDPIIAVREKPGA